MKINADAPFTMERTQHAIKWFFLNMKKSVSDIELNIIPASKDAFIEFFGSEEEGKNVLGLCTKLGPHKFNVRLRRSLLAMTDFIFYAILFEELYHVYQYETQMMTDSKDGTQTRYLNKWYPNDMPYKDQPWEIDAKKIASIYAKRYVDVDSKVA